MPNRTQRILEYDKITAQVASFCVSETGRRRCLAMRPYTKKEEVAHALALTRTAESVWFALGSSPMVGFEDCGDTAARCAIGATPSCKELLAVAKTLQAVQHVQTKLNQAGAEMPLQALCFALMPNAFLLQDITRCVRSEEDLYDDASPQLRELRRKIRGAEDKIRARLQAILANPTTRNMLQDGIITQRNGRYVVPVKSEYAGQIKGFEHDRSASGATLFIEPYSVLEANNELKDLEGKEQQEIERILSALGEEVGREKETLIQNVKTLSELDECFAKVTWSHRHKATCPILVEGDQMTVRQARHPLIDDKQVVPIDYTVGGDLRALLVTGPNTGGKTVTLKTAGLFVLLAQSGLFLPCEKAEMPVYRAVFADIGDEQSIEQSLSTFSSHMVNIVFILKKARPGVLVLLDELGAGTDPVEGAALAISILETMVEKGAVVACTTHYSELKSYAMSHPGFLNAGMEFDVESLRPTYKLMIGYAGSSNAFAISSRLGMPERVIQRAKDQMDSEAAAFERALAEAEQLRKQAEQSREQLTYDLQSQREAFDRELAQQKAQAQKLQKRAEETLEKARRTLETAREQANEAIETAKQAAKAENSAEREKLLQSAREQLRSLPEIQEKKREAPQAPGSIPKRVQRGESVYASTLDANATVLEPANKKGEVLIQAGVIKMKVPLESLRVRQQQKKQAPKAVVRRGERTAPLEIDVRGMTVDEAVMVIDLHLDDAILSGRTQTTIIHGKGTGALRAGVQEHLRHHPHVKSMRMGAYGEGDAGVTVVELK
ncbi:MAG: endonuclease MutS2 [Christensenellales bacterium]